MKSSFTLTSLFIVLSLSLSAQIGLNTDNPDPGAILDMVSTDKGILFPRLDIDDLTTIAPLTGSSTEGLIVYNTNALTGTGFYYWNGTDQWIPISTYNLYTGDGEITENREVTLGNNDLKFTGSNGRSALQLKRTDNLSQTGISFQNSDDTNAASIHMGTGVNASLFISAQSNNANANLLTSNAAFNDNGDTSLKRTFFYRNNLNTPSDNLGAVISSNNGGMFTISDDTGNYNHFLAGNSNSVLNSRNRDIDFWMNTVNRDFTFYVNSGTDRVGIGTFNPQTDLHLAGAGATMRIDGLSAANNANNNGTRPVSVHADANGNLVIPATPANAENALNDTNFMPDEGQPGAISLSTGTNGDLASGFLSSSGNFTVTSRTLVLVTYSVSVSFFNAANNGPVTDGKPKVAHNFINIVDTSTNTIVSNFVEGLTGQSYTNAASGGGYISTGFVYNSGTFTGFLDPGTYRVDLWGSVLSGNSTLGSVPSDEFTARFGQDPYEFIKIITLY
ncbi:hypothetical protein [Nonlabens xiamenensis]|uniref:hypothetical protein n=1 Tax=Nonlabens xiamenensis TaxID=2341043 RepID=UPI000F611E06|nr:hypothetical protein [Nonlabens xiamenensis]